MKEKGIVAVQSFVFLLFLLSSAILLTVLCTPLYMLNAWVQNLPEIAGLTMGQLLADYHRLIGYLLLPFEQAFPLRYFPSSASGIQHFVDVKQLLFVNTFVWIVTTPLSIYFYRRVRATAASWRFIRFFQGMLVVPPLFLVVMAFGFDRFFILFHETFFRNADWLFDPAVDPIINVLPESFFLQCFLFFFILFEGFLYLAYRKARGK